MLQSRNYETLLTYSQQKKYAAAITQGYFNNYDGLAWRHTFYGSWLWKHPNRVKVLTRFRQLIGHIPDWSDITDDNLRDFREVLSAHYAPNSVRTICAEINAVIRENAPSKDIPSQAYASIMKQKQDTVQAVALTDEEVQRIHQYTPHTLAARHVKRMFMLECLTGARRSDCEHLSIENLNPLERTITYVAQKTGIEVTVPMHKWVPTYLKRTSPSEPETVALSTYSRLLREMCQRCGINTRTKVFSAGQSKTGPKYMFVTSHTGRRSFATNLSHKGVALEQIALLMGHMSGNIPNISMTQRYIVGKMKIDPSVFRIFDE